MSVYGMAEKLRNAGFGVEIDDEENMTISHGGDDDRWEDCAQIMGVSVDEFWADALDSGEVDGERYVELI